MATCGQNNSSRKQEEPSANKEAVDSYCHMPATGFERPRSLHGRAGRAKAHATGMGSGCTGVGRWCTRSAG
eukprot:6192875-Pleurochrysis_carterae.AAC.3